MALLGAFCSVLLITTISGHRLGTDRCDVPADTGDADCGYYGIKELECIQRGCCWKPCHNCESTTPWCIKSREMFRPECQQKPAVKRECGHSGIHREECQRRGCCWVPSHKLNDIWCYHEGDVTVPTASTTSEGDLRILGSNSSGRLQTYVGGKWGTICDDLFDADALSVACRQLGFDGANAHMLPMRDGEDGMGEILLDNVVCVGNEDRILSCDHDSGPGNCNHREDVVISCEPYKQEIRLTGGNDGEGRLDVFYNGEWGTVCNDEFTERKARVVCRQLGYLDMSQVELKSTVSDPFPYVDRIWISNVYCEDDDDNIYDCFHTRWGDNYCSHSHDVYISCTKEMVSTTQPAVLGNGTLRLTKGNKTSAGILEVSYNGEWGYVCDDHFNFSAVQVACRQLGYSEMNNMVTYFENTPGIGLGWVFLDDVQCSGKELKLTSCGHGGWRKHNCIETEAIQIDCDASVGMRLSDGWKGRLEVEFNGEWGTVCDKTFGDREAKFVCKKLGHSYENTLTYNSIGTDDMPVGLEYVLCNNSKARNIFECSHSRWKKVYFCSHKDDVFIDCGGPGDTEGGSGSGSGSDTDDNEYNEDERETPQFKNEIDEEEDESESLRSLSEGRLIELVRELKEIDEAVHL